eukprot:gene7947-biopygen6091
MLPLFPDVVVAGPVEGVHALTGRCHVGVGCCDPGEGARSVRAGGRRAWRLASLGSPGSGRGAGCGVWVGSLLLLSPKPDQVWGGRKASTAAAEHGREQAGVGPRAQHRRDHRATWYRTPWNAAREVCRPKSVSSAQPAVSCFSTNTTTPIRSIIAMSTAARDGLSAAAATAPGTAAPAAPTRERQRTVARSTSTRLFSSAPSTLPPSSATFLLGSKSSMILSTLASGRSRSTTSSSRDATTAPADKRPSEKHKKTHPASVTRCSPRSAGRIRRRPRWQRRAVPHRR